MITRISITFEEPEVTRTIELRSGDRMKLEGQFWPRELRVINDVLLLMMDFNRTEGRHTAKVGGG